MRKAPNIQTTDLRSISRDPDRCLVQVSVGDTLWLQAGLCRLQKTGIGWLLKARMRDGYTDREGSSGYVFQLPLLAIELDYMEDHTFFYKGVISPDPRSFHVPRPGYDPLRDSQQLEDRWILPPGFWFPPFERELYEEVVARRCEFSIGPAFPED